MRICFIGDSFTQGIGDETELGWVSRIAIHVRKNRPDISIFNLGIRGNTSLDILNRWESEVNARVSDKEPFRLVFCFGANDCADDGRGRRRVSIADTISNTHVIMKAAQKIAPTIFIGPPPILDDQAADQRLSELELVMHGVANEHSIPFLPVFETMRRSNVWTAGAAAGDGTHPNAAGYTFFAENLQNWSVFERWL